MGTRIMSDPTVRALKTKVLCKHGGRLPRDLLPIYWELPPKKVKKILQNEPQKFLEVGKMVLARSPVRICDKYLKNEAEQQCDKLHLCRNYLRGKCWPGRRPPCLFSHDILSHQNRKVLKANEISGLNEDEIKVLLLQNDNQLLPEVCVKYLHDSCDLGKDCSWLHICGYFTRGECNRRFCKFSHHLLELGSDLLLTRCRMSEETVENFQMICTAKHEEHLKKVWAERKKEKEEKEKEDPQDGEQQERGASQDRKPTVRAERKKKKKKEKEKEDPQEEQQSKSQGQEEERSKDRKPTVREERKKEQETPGDQKGRGRPQNSKKGNPQNRTQRKGRRQQQGYPDLDNMFRDWLTCPPHESKDRLDIYFKMAETCFSIGRTVTQQPTPTACTSNVGDSRAEVQSTLPATSPKVSPQPGLLAGHSSSTSTSSSPQPKPKSPSVTKEKPVTPTSNSYSAQPVVPTIKPGRFSWLNLMVPPYEPCNYVTSPAASPSSAPEGPRAEVAVDCVRPEGKLEHEALTDTQN